jgi:hypothetical protein
VAVCAASVAASKIALVVEAMQLLPSSLSTTAL